jgi:O-antigen/teichoic acid export membrane protein
LAPTRKTTPTRDPTSPDEPPPRGSSATLLPASAASSRAGRGAKGGIANRIARGSAWTISTRIAGMIGGFVASALAAHVLSRPDFGAYILATSVVTTAAIIGHFGLPRTVVRLVADALAREERGTARGAIHTVAWLNVVGGVAVGAILAFGGGEYLAHHLFHRSGGLATVMVFVGVWAAAEGIRFTFSETFRGFHDIRLASLLGDPMRSVFLALGFVVLKLTVDSTSLRTAVLVSLAASLLTCVLAAAFLWPKTRSLHARARRVAPAMVLAIAIPLTLTDLTGMIVAQGDVWVVGAFRSSIDVGVYGAASRIVIMMSLPLFVMNGVVAPMIAELWAQGRTRALETMLRGATTLATIPSVLGFAVVAVAGGPIMRIAYGPHFARGGHILAILAFGVAFGVAAGSCNFALIMTGHHRVVAVVSALTLVVAVGGEIVGAHVAGLTGIAVASSGSTVFQNVVLTAMAKQRIGIWTHATLSPRKVRAFLALRG